MLRSSDKKGLPKQLKKKKKNTVKELCWQWQASENSGWIPNFTTLQSKLYEIVFRCKQGDSVIVKTTLWFLVNIV